MPRAPKGYWTNPHTGEILKRATFADYSICPQSNKRVTTAQRARRTHDCPTCGAPDIGWHSEVDPAVEYWDKHRKGDGNHTQLDIYDTEEKSDESIAPF